MFKGCTFLPSFFDLFLANNYTGPFNLSGVTNFNRPIGRQPSNLTTVVLNDLESLGSFRVWGSSTGGMTSVSAPKLAVVRDLTVEAFSPVSFDFHLATAVTFNMLGNVSS